MSKDPFDPIKIIWKYKNNDRRTQYNLYIFLGEFLNDDKSMMDILDKIKNKTLLDTLLLLDNKEYNKLVDTYGDFWYKYFFTKYHIEYTINNLKKTGDNIKSKYGNDWYDKHIKNNMKNEKNIIISYENKIKEDYKRMNRNKIVIGQLDLDNYKIDKTKTSRIGVKQDENIINKLDGGNDNYNDDIDDNYNDDIDDNYDENGMDNDNMDEIDNMYEDDDIDIESLYNNIDVNFDENISKTSLLIKEAFDDDTIFSKTNNKMTKFDTSDDNNKHNMELYDIYKKNYVYQYIYKDDTIQTIKNKICCGIKMNDKFGLYPYLIPSRQYIWTEYYFNNVIEKIMLGAKWTQRGEILSIDVEPHNIFRKYEQLEDELSKIRDDIKRHGKIRYDNDDNNILFDYVDYVYNNEIYMIDIYNELGVNYNTNNEYLKNVQDVYLKLYFPHIRSDELKNIIEYLNNNKKVEESKIKNIYDTINNDLIIENEIMNTVEHTKMELRQKNILLNVNDGDDNATMYKSFKHNYITQSVIHVYLTLLKGNIDLYRIFNNFIPSEKYPFISLTEASGIPIYKLHKDSISTYLQKKENYDIGVKWFENIQYGINFKIRLDNENNEKLQDKFISMTLESNGKIEYKTQWKEEDRATISDIKKTYTYVIELINKLNDSNENRIVFEIPDVNNDNTFKYAFMNTIQKFELPNEYELNHNELSEFSRYFYPYIAIVVEPRKRVAKNPKKSSKSGKYGTYVRYKRISKYDNRLKMEQRIIYFIRNYEHTDETLASEISKQFNITETRALEEIKRIKHNNPHIRKARKVLKKLENIPKYKTPGIGIDIQGRTRDNYKIRVAGARNKEQLDRIIYFMNILIYLYIEIYIHKNTKYNNLKNKLKQLANIAKRRSKVDDIIKYESSTKLVKQITSSDKHRLLFKTEKGQNQWTRSCQNSGNDKRRRPQQHTNTNIEELVNTGYIYNKSNGLYERTIIKKSKDKDEKLTLKTIKVPELDEDGNKTGNNIYYSCSPEENGEHMYVGFLTRSTNPNGFCMPCCFKKDPRDTKNKEKKQFFLSCLEGAVNDKTEVIDRKNMGDILYILQDTHKIHENRLGFLNKWLDIYFNKMFGRDKKIKHNYLAQTDGYFYKYGTKQDDYPFLNSIANALNITIDDIKTRLIDALINDKNEQIFTSLGNGDIKSRFKSIENYINYITYSSLLDFDTINNLISIPNVLYEFGINIIVFVKKIIIKKNIFEKDDIKDDFTLLCTNTEDIYSITDKNRINIILVKEDDNFYPIYFVIKESDNSKDINLIKTFKYDENDNNNIINHIKDFQQKTCMGTFTDKLLFNKSNLSVRELNNKLNNIKNNNDKYKIKYQVVDTRNKCKYIILNNNTIIPIKPSGTIYNINLMKDIDKYITNLQVSYDNLIELSKYNIPVKPIGVYYSDIKNNSDSNSNNDKLLKVIALVLESYEILPITEEYISSNKLDNMNLIYDNKPLTNKLDIELSKKENERKINIDDRIINVNLNKYDMESYELFRFEFSNFINKNENNNLKKKIENIIKNPKNIGKTEKLEQIKLIIYRLIDKK